MCYSGAGLEQLKQEGQNSSQGEEYESRTGRRCYPLITHWIKAVRQSQINLPKGKKTKKPDVMAILCLHKKY